MFIKVDPSSRRAVILNTESVNAIKQCKLLINDRILFQIDDYWTLMTTQGKPLQMCLTLKTILQSRKWTYISTKPEPKTATTTVYLSTRCRHLVHLKLDWNSEVIWKETKTVKLEKTSLKEGPVFGHEFGEMQE